MSSIISYIFGSSSRSSKTSSNSVSSLKHRPPPPPLGPSQIERNSGSVRNVRIQGGGRGGAISLSSSNSSSGRASFQRGSTLPIMQSSSLRRSENENLHKETDDNYHSPSDRQMVTRSNPRYNFTPGLYEPAPARHRGGDDRIDTRASSVTSLPTITTQSSSSSSTAGATAAGASVPQKLCCDKCDGKHPTDDCPYYKKSRDAHPDAQKNFYKKLGGTSTLPGQTLRNSRVVRQPGDGSCLFHSMSYGLTDGHSSGSSASRLRAEICEFIKNNPGHKICETPLEDWIKWDSGGSCSSYASKMSRGSWGGGIEMAVMSHIKCCNVHVYERAGFAGVGGFRRISAFDHPDTPERRKCVKVLYQGGVHYDALV